MKHNWATSFPEWKMTGEAKSFFQNMNLTDKIVSAIEGDNFFPRVYVKMNVTVQGKRCAFYVCLNLLADSEERMRVVCIDERATQKHHEYIQQCLGDIFAKASRKFKSFAIKNYCITINP